MKVHSECEFHIQASRENRSLCCCKTATLELPAQHEQFCLGFPPPFQYYRTNTSCKSCWWLSVRWGGRDPIPCSRDPSHASPPSLLLLALKVPYFEVSKCVPRDWHCPSVSVGATALQKFSLIQTIAYVHFYPFSFPNGFLFPFQYSFFQYILLLLFLCYVSSSLSILAFFFPSSAQQLLASYSESK